MSQFGYHFDQSRLQYPPQHRRDAPTLHIANLRRIDSSNPRSFYLGPKKRTLVLIISLLPCCNTNGLPLVRQP